MAKLERGQTSWRLTLRRVMPVLVLLLAAVSVPCLIFARTGLERLDNLRAEREQVDREAARLAFEIRQLREQVERARTRAEDVERVARDELGLVRQTELVFQFAP